MNKQELLNLFDSIENDLSSPRKRANLQKIRSWALESIELFEEVVNILKED